VAGGLRATAAQLRARCRTDKELLGRLCGELLDPATAADRREAVAFVLGSLPDPEAARALRQALDAATDAEWIRTLVLALGCALDTGRDDSFDLYPAPYVHLTPHGLSVEIFRVIPDPDTRAALQRRLEHDDREVRRAVLLVLQHTLIGEARSGENFADLRRSFLGAVEREADEGLRAEAGRALAQWLAAAPAGRAGHVEVAETVIRRALEPGEDQIRFRALAGLKSAALEERDLARVLEAGGSDAAFERRAWAIELAAAQAERVGVDRVRDLLATGLQDGNAKLREVAARELACAPKDDRTLGLVQGALQDPAWHVRYAAARTLGGFPPGPEVVNALERASKADPHPAVREIAERGLKNLRR
jgi:HEAT repeat protein